MLVNFAPPQAHVIYPDSDGLPMAESDFQRVPLGYAVEALTLHFADERDVYVSGNMFLYYVEGHPELVVAPDVFVVFGVSKRERYSYKIWEEGKAPDLVIEITSRATKEVDQGPKRGLYAYLGVREYWQYDPTGDYLEPPLQLARLRGQGYEDVPIQVSGDGTVSGYSEVLGLELRVNLERREFRFFDPRQKTILPSYEEWQARALAAEAEIERLRAELARRAKNSE